MTYYIKGVKTSWTISKDLKKTIRVNRIPKFEAGFLTFHVNSVNNLFKNTNIIAISNCGMFALFIQIIVIILDGSSEIGPHVCGGKSII